MVRYDSDSDSDNNSDTTRCDTMPRETIRYDADTIWIRYGYSATRYDTLVRDNDGSLPPDRVREPIKFKLQLCIKLLYFNFKFNILSLNKLWYSKLKLW